MKEAIYLMDLDKIKDRLNWATCNGLNEAGIEYWSYKEDNNFVDIYFKNKIFMSFDKTFHNSTVLVSEIVCRANDYTDKDMKRFLKYIKT